MASERAGGESHPGIWELTWAGQHVAAQAEGERAVAAAQDPGQLAAAETALGVACVWGGQAREGEPHLSRAVDLRREAFASHTTDEARDLLATALFELGACRRSAGDDAGALACLAEARSHHEFLLAALGTDNARRNLSMTWFELGVLEHRRGDLESAAGLLSRAVEVDTGLYEADRTTGARRSLSFTLWHLGQVEVATGDDAAAEVHLRAAAEHLEGLRAAGTTQDAASNLALVLGELAGIEARHGHREAAEAYLARMLEVGDPQPGGGRPAIP